MPGAVWFPGAQVNYAGQRLWPRRRGACRRPPGDRLSRRGDAARGRTQEIAWPELRRQVAASPPRSSDGRRAGRPRRRLPAERAAGGGRVPRLREHRRDLVDLLARHGAARRARPLPPDRAEGAGRVRRLSLRRRRVRAAAAAAASARGAAERAATSSLWRGLDRQRRRRRARVARAPRPRLRRARRRRRARSRRGWLPFDHPLWIVYSSGTTGLPKPIVHGHGGVMLEALKFGTLHNDFGPSVASGDRFHWYSRPAGSCGTRRCRRCSAAPRVHVRRQPGRAEEQPAGRRARGRLDDALALRRRQRRDVLRRRRRVLRELREGGHRAGARRRPVAPARARIDRLAARDRELPLGARARARRSTAATSG